MWRMVTGVFLLGWIGALSARAHVASLLDGVQALEPQVQAWAHLDEAAALAQAQACDARRQAGERAPLMGVAVGLNNLQVVKKGPRLDGIMASARDGVVTPSNPEMGRFWAAMKTALTSISAAMPRLTRFSSLPMP